MQVKVDIQLDVQLVELLHHVHALFACGTIFAVKEEAVVKAFYDVTEDVLHVLILIMHDSLLDCSEIHGLLDDLEIIGNTQPIRVYGVVEYLC